MCDFERYNIKVVEGNEFTLLLPLKSRTFVASRPVDEDIVIEDLENLRVFVNNDEYSSARQESDGVAIDFPPTLKQGNYDVVLTATYHGVDIRAAYDDAVIIVAWNQQSDAQQYIQGSPFVLPAAYVLGVMSDSELEALKAQLRLEIAAAQRAKEEADAAKAEYIAKAEALDDVAQQSTLTQGVQDIREDISHIDIDTSNLAKQGSDAGATLTDTQAAAQQAARDAAAAKTTAQAIAGYALQGNDPTKTNTQLSAEIGQIALNAQTLESMADSWEEMVTNRKSIDGFTFENMIPDGCGDIFFNILKITHIHDTTTTQFTTGLTLYNVRSLILDAPISISGISRLISDNNIIQYFKATNLEVLDTTYQPFNGCGNLEVIELPKLKQLKLVWGIANCPLLKEIHMPSTNSASSTNNTFGSNCPNLILVELGAITTSFSLAPWSPTSALDASSQTLLTPEDIAAGLTSNLQKLLYNIREHIAANLPVSNNTVTFSSAVKAAILADQATADAFTNKGWTIA